MAEGRFNTGVVDALVISESAVAKHVNKHLQQVRPVLRFLKAQLF